MCPLLEATSAGRPVYAHERDQAAAFGVERVVVFNDKGREILEVDEGDGHAGAVGFVAGLTSIAAGTDTADAYG